MRTSTIARWWFGLTALVVLAAVVISLVLALTGDDPQFGSPLADAFNIFAYFTIQSNIIVGLTSLLLALRPQRRSTLFRVFRLDGLIMILVTAIVFHALLAGLVGVSGWSSVSNQLVHTVVPALAVLGWLVFGPRGLVSWRVVAWSVVYPLLWVLFTLVRGAVTGWYPYPFLDVGELGYPRVALTILGITVAFVALAAGLHWVDGWSARVFDRQGRRASAAPEAAVDGPSEGGRS
ncbi:MAG: Pr6Pr family membrane protein [Actinobacteria bacterium]|nr:Pr6Pr family membrane protein [Actinomycetota bacterium]